MHRAMARAFRDHVRPQLEELVERRHDRKSPGRLPLRRFESRWTHQYAGQRGYLTALVERAHHFVGDGAIADDAEAPWVLHAAKNTCLLEP